MYDVVLILRTAKAVKTFTHPRITLGGEIAVTVGEASLPPLPGCGCSERLHVLQVQLEMV